MVEQRSLLERTEAALEHEAAAAGADHAASAGPQIARVVERSPRLLRQVNELMRDGRRGETEQERIPFFCECERADCYEPVWLTSDMYDERLFHWRQPLVLPGHELATSEAREHPGAR